MSTPVQKTAHAWSGPIQLICAALALIALLCLPSVVWAQAAPEAGGTVDAMIEAMRRELTTLGENAGQAARNLLLILFVIDLVLRFGRFAHGQS